MNTAQKTITQLQLHDQVMSPLPDLLFGQFMERASFGEPGPESACDDQGNIRPSSLTLLQEMAPPCIRFPGGTDIDYLDWHDLIDYAPLRSSEKRPEKTGRNDKYIGTRFGMIEFLRFMQEMPNSEAILVLNIGSSWLCNDTDKEACIAHHCAAMLAFVNAPLDNNLPEHLKGYPLARAKAGHPQPFAIKKWQIGNETWILPRHFEGFSLDDPNWVSVQQDRISIAIQQMKSIDPSIEIIIDGGNLAQLTCNYNAFKDQADYFSFHYYKPMGGPTLIDSRNQESLSSTKLSAEELYNWMVAAPEANADAYSAFDNDCFDFIRTHQVPIAFTEWNWNGWFRDGIAENNWHWRGMGAAGILHALMRDAQHIKLACQSMCIGSGWGIMSICVDPNDSFEPFMHPSGLVTKLYSQYHGTEIVSSTQQHNDYYDALFKSEWHKPVPKMARIDTLVSRDADHYYVHIINRHQEATQLSLNGFPKAKAQLHSMVQDSAWPGHRSNPASRIDQTAIVIQEDSLLPLAAASVNVLVIPRRAL